MTTLATFHGGPLDATSDALPGDLPPARIVVAIWTPLPCWSPDVALACHIGRYVLAGREGDGARYVYRGSRVEVPV